MRLDPVIESDPHRKHRTRDETFYEQEPSTGRSHVETNRDYHRSRRLFLVVNHETLVLLERDQL